MMKMSNLEQLLACHEIEQALYRYARGVDRRDWDMVRSCYHSDAHDDHGRFQGDVEGLVAWLERRHPNIDQSLHYVQNCSIEFASDSRALVESYVIVFQRLGPDATETRGALPEPLRPAPDETVDVRFLARCVDTFELRDGKVGGLPAESSFQRQSEWIPCSRERASIRLAPAARRDRDDAYYVMRKELFGN